MIKVNFVAFRVVFLAKVGEFDYTFMVKVL